MTSSRNKRKFTWWPNEIEWFSQKVDKWLLFGNGYCKLRASISTKSVVDQEETRKPQPPSTAPSQNPESIASSSKFKMCRKYGEEVCKNYSEKLYGTGNQRSQLSVTRSFSVKEGKKTITRQDWARSSYSLKRRNVNEQSEPKHKSKTLQRFTSSVVPSEVIFEKCKPRQRQGTLRETECPNHNEPCCVESNDIVYYPFREEDCVVCKYIFERANNFRMNVEPLQQVACTTDGCHFLYSSKSFPCNTGQLHSGCKSTRCASLTNSMSKCTLRETRITNDYPQRFYENNFCKKSQPTINVNQNYIEICYDDIRNNNDSVCDFTSETNESESEQELEVRRKPERPPPTYLAVIRRENSYVRPRKCTYQHQNGEDRFYIHDSPFINNARVSPKEPSYRYMNGEDNRFKTNHNLNGRRRTNSLPHQNLLRESRYRSQGRFSHTFYETEQAVRDTFEVNGNTASSRPNNVRRGGSFTYRRPTSVLVDNQSPNRLQLREVDLKSSNPLRNVMSFRSRNGKSNSRRKKSVVVGEDGFQGPMWPRVLLTFDRGVTPNAPYSSSGQFATTESDA